MGRNQPKKYTKRSRISRVRFLTAFFVVFCFAILIGKLVKIQIVDAAFYQEKANANQTKDLIITPKRGTIYDRNMTELVTSATTQEIDIDPSIIRKYGENSVEKKTDADGKTITPTDAEVSAAVIAYQEKTAKLLSDSLDLDYEETLTKVQKDTQYVRIARRVDTTVANQLIADADEQGIHGITTAEDSKRYYTYSQFASQLLGFTSDDGEGLYGVEYSYNDQLEGVAGRVVKATNAKQTDDMPYDYEEYTAAQDGDGVVLTIDEAVQHYLEKHLEEALSDNDAQAGVCGIVMDVNTGEILAMSTKPDFDLNNPKEIPEEYSELYAQLDGLSGEEYTKKYSEILLKLWRNKTMNDTYEPGSTFKIFTVSSALEEGVVSDSDTFVCGGSKQVDSWNIHCWKDGGHGTQVLAETLQNSCNVAMMDISARLGIDMFRKYFQAYGLTEKTGIDLPGEATGIFFDDSMNDVDLATGSFGQNFQVTPIQELCMVSAAVNGGDLVTPHVMKEIVDTDGNVKQAASTEVKRQVISASTSETMREYLEEVVTLGTGQNAYVAGYRVGGKTATTEKLPKSSKNRIASFIGIAPMDDPQYAVLIMIDEPQGSTRGGGAIAAPVCARVFEDILPYLGVEAIFSEDEEAREEITVPNMADMSLEEAEAALDELGLSYTVQGEGDTVTDQSPVAGISLQSFNTVVLYAGEAKDASKVEVPDVSGMSIDAARQQLADYGFYMKQNGVADWRATSSSIAFYQSPAAGTAAETGSVVTVAFGNAVTSEE